MLVHPLNLGELGEPFGPLVPQFLDLVVDLGALAFPVAIQAEELQVGRERVDEPVGCTGLVFPPVACIVVS
jgi:hypothetical protein